jgi:hypothetical protein
VALEAGSLGLRGHMWSVPCCVIAGGRYHTVREQKVTLAASNLFIIRINPLIRMDPKYLP